MCSIYLHENPAFNVGERSCQGKFCRTIIPMPVLGLIPTRSDTSQSRDMTQYLEWQLYSRHSIFLRLVYNRFPNLLTVRFHGHDHVIFLLLLAHLRPGQSIGLPS